MIKLVDPKAILKIISTQDEAIDSETSDELEELRKKGEPSRYEQFLDTLDLSKLKIKDGQKASIFHVRCLLNSEVAEINQAHLVVDPVKKRVDYRDKTQMYLKICDKCLIGMEDENGNLVKVSSDELGYLVGTDLGNTIWLLTSLRKNLKNG